MKRYALGLYEKAVPNELSFEEKMIAAKLAGYDYIEISIDESEARLARLDWSGEERLKLIRTVYDTGVEIGSMCLSGHRKFPLGSLDEDIRKRSMEIMEKALQLACDLGIRTIQLAGYDVYYEQSNGDTRKYFLDNLHKATEMAHKYGVLMGFETMETSFMDTVEKAMFYVNEVNSPYLGVYPDLGNLTNASKIYGSDVYEDIRKGNGHLISMHLKETVPGKYREIPFGTGHVDFDDGIKAALETGVRRFVTEFWYTGDPLWKSDLMKTGEMFNEKLRKMTEELV